MQHDFWDTSALAKLYLNERGSGWAVGRASSSAVAYSRLAVAEIASVFARRCALGDVSRQQRDILYREFLTDSRQFVPVDITDALISDASELLLAGTFGTRVRSLDAIQLATARWWFEQARALNIEPGAFVVADGSLRDAAVALGLAVENPEDHE